MIELDASTDAYVRLTAFNRFIDNMERALKGDKECRDNLLFDDIPSMREHGTTVWRAIQNNID